MRQLLFLPLLIPLATAIAGLFAWKQRRLQRLLSLSGNFALVAAAVLLLSEVRREGIITVQAGGWPAPFGITLVADLLSAVMVLLAGVMAMAVSVYSLASADIEHEALGYHPLMQVLLLGVCGSFLTGDLFNLYVWFEVMLIASFALLALGRHREQMEGAVKYLALNLVASAFFLAGVGILYGLTGTLNMADLARQLHASRLGGMDTVVAMLFFAAFGIKSALFPLFFWLPASYHTPPVAVSTIFSALLTKVGIYGMIRLFTLIFIQDQEYLHTLFLLIAGLTMVTGGLGAAVQYDFRRLLSFHIISQVGYLLMGLGIFTPLALAASIFFMVHVIVAKAALFMVSGIVRRIAGHYRLKELGGIYESHPFVAALFLVPALSLSGMPPLSGFWAKLALVRAALETQHYMMVAAALVMSLMTLFYMTRIWSEAFWKERPENGFPGSFHQLSAASRAQLLAPTALLALLTVLLGIVAEPVFGLALEAGAQLMNPELYMEAVLGRPP